MLDPVDYDVWLSNGAHTSEALSLLGPYPPAPIAFYRVSTLVNSYQNDTPEVIEALSD